MTAHRRKDGVRITPEPQLKLHVDMTPRFDQQFLPHRRQSFLGANLGLSLAVLFGLGLLGCQSGGTEQGGTPTCVSTETKVQDPSDKQTYTYIRCEGDCARLNSECVLQRRLRPKKDETPEPWQDVGTHSMEVLAGKGTNLWAWKNPKFQWRCTCK